MFLAIKLSGAFCLLVSMAGRDFISLYDSEVKSVLLSSIYFPLMPVSEPYVVAGSHH